VGAPPERAITLGPGEGPAIWTLGGRFTMKAESRAAEGRLAIIEVIATRAAEPPLHIHTREDEAWYVLDGAMTFYLADVPYRAVAGSLVYAPMGVPHVFTVDVEPTRVLLIATPGGFERFARELGTPVEGETPPPSLELPDPSVLTAVAARYGIEVIGPPWRVSHPEPG
jgi:quercetin dioxygenase-like cupin family protein